MSTWRGIRAALRRAKREMDESVEEFTTRANETLDRKERELNASPTEKLALEQERGRSIDDQLEAVRRRIKGRDGGRAD